MKAVAFFSDKNMLPGLHVALASLLKSINDSFLKHLKIYIFLDNVHEKEKDLIRRTFTLNSQRENLLTIRDYSPTPPTGGNLLHGNATTYGRLYLSQLLPEIDECLYLDSDLIVNNDILHFFNYFDNEHVILVDGTGIRINSLDKKLYEEAGLNMHENCFNAGVLGINLKLWRSLNMLNKCQDVAQKYYGKFKSGDQALLNVVFHNSFKSVGDRWNFELSPTHSRINYLDKYIYHFIGSPKPWDILGWYLHNNYHLWYDLYKSTAISNYLPWMRYSSLKRNTRIIKSYYTTLRAKLKNPQKH